jgi:hypothetical protein
MLECLNNMLDIATVSASALMPCSWPPAATAAAADCADVHRVVSRQAERLPQLLHCIHEAGRTAPPGYNAARHFTSRTQVQHSNATTKSTCLNHHVIACRVLITRRCATHQRAGRSGPQCYKIANSSLDKQCHYGSHPTGTTALNTVLHDCSVT